MLGIDQVIRGIGKEGGTAHGAGPLRRRIRGRDELRLNGGSRTPGSLIESGQILLNGAAGLCAMILSRPRAAWDGALIVGVSRNQAGIDRKAFASNQTLGQAPLDDCFEQMAQDVALAEAAVAVA